MTAVDTITCVPAKTRFSEKLGRAIHLGWDGSQAELASAIGVSRQSLNQYIGDKPSTPKTWTTFLLAKNLNVSLSWLMDESDTRLEPVWVAKNPLLKDAEDDAISAELKRRLKDAAATVDDLIDRFEHYPWEEVSAWLLSRFLPPQPTSPLVLAGIDLYKKVESPSARLRILGESTTPGERRVTVFKEGVPTIIDTGELLSRIDAIREAHPGVLAFSYYLLGFDEDWHPGQIEKYGDDPTPDWDDRRAWLMAQIVSNESLKGAKLYEPIRARLREMKYLTDEGDARDYGYSKDGLGDFDLPEPG